MNRLEFFWGSNHGLFLTFLKSTTTTSQVNIPSWGIDPGNQKLQEILGFPRRWSAVAKPPIIAVATRSRPFAPGKVLYLRQGVAGEAVTPWSGKKDTADLVWKKLGQHLGHYLASLL